jgi:hypothetical protein
MNENNFDDGAHANEDLARLWREHDAAPSADLVARTLMAQTWQFDQKIFWRNFREYAAGIVLLVVFAGQIALDRDGDRIGGIIGFMAVAFVMVYLWWRHRGLGPLDPTAPTTLYQAALLARLDDQIRLLRTVPYWYLVPLSLPGLWMTIVRWPVRPGLAAVSLAIQTIAFVFVGWLNVRVGVQHTRVARDRVAAMLPPSEG